MTWYLILFLVTFPLSVGLIYGAVARLVAGWLKDRGWQVRDIEDQRTGWEPEDIYNLPPNEEWLTLWEAYRMQREIKK
jgi:hypothetical protein